MSDEKATLQDVWRLLGSMNKRFGERFDALEREMVAFKVDVAGRIDTVEARIGMLDASVTGRIGALKDSIEARDFRLDEQGRRLTRVEDSLR